eukprot:6650010-Pyramimonas_sp.AAC.2
MANPHMTACGHHVIQLSFEKQGHLTSQRDKSALQSTLEVYNLPTAGDSPVKRTLYLAFSIAGSNLSLRLTDRFPILSYLLPQVRPLLKEPIAMVLYEYSPEAGLGPMATCVGPYLYLTATFHLAVRKEENFYPAEAEMYPVRWVVSFCTLNKRLEPY